MSKEKLFKLAVWAFALHFLVDLALVGMIAHLLF